MRVAGLVMVVVVASCGSGPSERLGNDADVDAPATCGDVLTDPANCGVCGHSCGTSSCTNGVCAPTKLASAKWPMRVAVDDTTVYWTQASAPGVQCVPKQGGTASTISDETAYYLALDATHLYWSASGQKWIHRAPVGGGTVQTVVDFSHTVADIVLDSGQIYWTNATLPGAVGVIAKTGGIQTMLADYSTPWLEGPMHPAVTSTDVYWEQGKLVARVPVAGGTPMQVPIDYDLASRNFEGFAVDATDMYLGVNTPIAGGAILRVPLAGGPATELATGVATTQELVRDGEYVYWTDGGTGANNFLDGRVSRVSINGGPVLVLAEGQAEPLGLTVDATSVYWVNNWSGTPAPAETYPAAVMMVAK